MRFDGQDEPILGGGDTESGGEERAAGGPLRLRSWRPIAMTAALLAVSGVLAVATRSRRAPLEPAAAGQEILLDDVPMTKEDFLNGIAHDPCNKMPYLRIMGILSDNLGGKGPETEQPEGIVYKAEPHNCEQGFDEHDHVELHMHVVGEEYFGHHLEEGDTVPADYHPEWPKVNGITGHFSTVNIHPGTNVTLRIYGYDANMEKEIPFPRWALTFFDLDTGKDGTNSVEFLRVKNFKKFFVSNETELKIDEEADGSVTFTGTREGTGKDNPTDPLVLSRLQKNRAVSFAFDDSPDVIVQLGASAGSTGRVFQWVARPIMRCAFTELENGDLIAADAADSPITLVEHQGTTTTTTITTTTTTETNASTVTSTTEATTTVDEGERRKNGSGHAGPAAGLLLSLALLVAARAD